MAQELTPDGRYLIIDGRKWRASDPTIPEALRKQLVRELMAARRAVGAAKRAGAGEEDHGMRAARARVQDAKVALGERGEPWWEEPSAEGRRGRLAAVMRTLLRSREPEKTICPSEAARVIGGEGWRELMDEARSVAAEGARAGEFKLRSGGEPVGDLGEHNGPLRVGRAPGFPSA